MPRLAIAGYYGFGNAGDEAILESTVEALRQQIPGVVFDVLTADPAGARERLGVGVIPRFSPSAVLNALRKSDMFVFGGGSLLQDVTSLRSLVYYLSLLFAAQRFGVPTMIYANGFGPVNSALGKALTRAVVNRVSAITLRDSDSARQMQEMGITRAPIKVTADPAFALEPASQASARAILEEAGLRPGKRPVVGVSLRPWQDSEVFVTAVAGACDMIQDDLDAAVFFLPMQQTRDRPLSEAVSGRMKLPAPVLSRQCSPRELMACAGSMDAMVGMRLHSLIFAVASGVPAAGIVYDPKIRAFLDAAGCPSAGAPAELEARTLFETVRGLLENAGPVKQALVAKREEFRRLALENARIAKEVLLTAKRRMVREP